MSFVDVVRQSLNNIGGKYEMISRKEALEPIKCTCGECGGTAYIMPFPEPEGTCLCGNCTFGDKTLSLADMLKKVFCKT